MMYGPEKVFDDFEDLVVGVADQTGVDPEDVRKVLYASFPSTKAYIIRQLAEEEARTNERVRELIGKIVA